MTAAVVRAWGIMGGGAEINKRRVGISEFVIKITSLNFLFRF